MKIKRLYVATLWAPDVPAAVHFYREVLGLEMLPQEEDPHPHFRIGETLIVILPSEGPITQAGQTVRFPCLAFEVEAIAPVAEELQRHGVELPWGIEEDEDSRWVMCHDPAGNLIEIAELK